MKDEINLQVSVGRQPTRRQLERQRIEVKMAQIRTRQAECMVQLLGRWVTFRSAYTGSNVASFRYYDHTVARLQHILASQMRNESRKDARALREAQADAERLDWLAKQVKSRNLSLTLEPFNDDITPAAEPFELWQKDENSRNYLAAAGSCLRDLIDSAIADAEAV